MKNLRTLKTLFMACALLAGAPASYAMSHAGAPMTPPSGAASMAEMADGEVRKIDIASKKITLKHGEIKSMDMPPMTMVFQVKDVAMLEKVKPGDKVRFKAEKSGGAMVVTEIQASK
jgi:Cu(I)/Ag(I) efflux system periplasmic protein CusF